MYPTRPAPSPPTLRGSALPPNHPFATYYLPLQHTHAHNVSDSTDSFPRTYRDKDRFAPSSPSSMSTRTSTSSSSSTSVSESISPPRSGRRPTPTTTAFLAQPLSPRSSPARHGYDATRTLGHYSSYSSSVLLPHTTAEQQCSGPTYAPHPANSRSSSSSPPQQSPSPTGGELAIFDARACQTLVGDVEYILGKKLRFPFLSSLTRSARSARSDMPKTEHTEKKKVKRSKKGKLVKEKEYDEDWVFWDGVGVEGDVTTLVVEKCPEPVRVQRRYRGVKEGNWV